MQSKRKYGKEKEENGIGRRIKWNTGQEKKKKDDK